MKASHFIIAAVCLFAFATARCSAQPRPDQATQPVDAPSTKSALSSIALDDIEPHISLPERKVQPDGEPPLEALHLYAQARVAWLDSDRSAAIDLLKQAAAIDPNSFYLHITLGRMYRKPGVEFSDQSIAMLEKAAAIEPDHLDLQMDLGRQLEAKGDVAGAAKHLRLALLTSGYRAEPGSAAVAEFFLGNLLRNQGYDRAALELYERLSAHLKSPEVLAKPSREVALLLSQADVLDIEMAEMLARCGKFPEAVAAFAAQVEKNPGNFDLRSHQVHLLLALKRNDDAVAAAQNAVVHFRASRESVSLLNEACEAAGNAGGAAGVLELLLKDHPADHPILYALADTLRADKKAPEADQLLAKAAADDPGDFGILRRRFDLAMDRQEKLVAARLLVEANFKRPELVTLITPLWVRLSSPTKPGRLRYTELAKLDVPILQEAAKWFWVSRLASAAHRDDISRSAIDRAIILAPIFAPAFRDRIDDIAGRPDLDAEQKRTEVGYLCHAPKGAGFVALADELNGIWELRDGHPDAASKDFADAEFAGGRSIDLLMEQAQAKRAAGDDGAADSILWKLVSDHPDASDAFEELCLSSWRRGLENQAERALSLWLEANPDDVTAWRVQSVAYMRSGRDKAAGAILQRQLDEHGDDPQVIAALDSYYRNSREFDGKLVEAFQALHARFPANISISMMFAEALGAAQRGDEAMKIADAVHAAVLDDPDILYSVSGLYSKIGKKEASEKTLEEVLKLDPSHPGAANDLGYLWADDGRKLAEAQASIEQALKAEPHNISFLDSLGWVFYKRGDFGQAKRYLDQAIGKQPARSDPALLDHRGDTLYRLGNKDAAAADWQMAADAIAALKDDAGPDQKDLRDKLAEKIRLLKAGEKIVTAPVAAP